MSRWYEQCMAQMTWAKFGEPMTREWTSNLIERSKSLGIEVLIFGSQLGGHIAGHTKMAPPIPDMEDDVLGQLCEEGHAKSLRIVPYFMSTTGGCQIQVREHPDWIAMGPEGKARMALCYSSPFGDWMEALIRDLYTKYPLDGIMFDQLSAACYCQFCLENFRRQYGHEMPREKQFARMAPGLVNLSGGKEAQELYDFRIRMARFFCYRIRRALDRARPNAIYIQNSLYGPAAADCAEFVDAFLPERHLGESFEFMPDPYLGNPHDIGSMAMSARLARAYSSKPVWSYVDYCYFHHAHAHTPEHSHLMLMEAVGMPSSPTLVDLNVLDHTPNRRADLTRALRQVLWSSDAQRGARPIRYAALLHSRDSQAHYKAEHNSEFYGYYEVLRGERVPVEVVTEHGVQQGDLDGFKVLIVPDAVCLADETIAAIERFVQAGGGLIATYRSGEQDPNGNIRTEAGFAGLTGVRPIKLVAFDAELTYPSREAMVNIPSIDVSPGKSFFRYARAAAGHPAIGGLTDELLAFRAGYVEAVYEQDTETAVWMLETDQAKINMNPYNRRGLFPGDPLCPLVSTREPAGRVVYVAATLGPERSRMESYELDKLIGNLVVWAAGSEPPLAAEGLPPVVQFSLTERDDGAVIVTVTNHATNPVRTGAPSATASGQATDILQTTHPITAGSIRWVAHMNQIRFRVRAAGRRTIESATGTARLVEQNDGWVSVELPRLGPGDCVVLSKT